MFRTGNGTDPKIVSWLDFPPAGYHGALGKFGRCAHGADIP